MNNAELPKLVKSLKQNKLCATKKIKVEGPRKALQIGENQE